MRTRRWRRPARPPRPWSRSPSTGPPEPRSHCRTQPKPARPSMSRATDTNPYDAPLPTAADGAPAAATRAEGDQPTHIRFYIIAATTLASFLLYLDRICISGIIHRDSVAAELGLSTHERGSVLGIFFLVYAL